MKNKAIINVTKCTGKFSTSWYILLCVLHSQFALDRTLYDYPYSDVIAQKLSVEMATETRDNGCPT